MANIFYQRVSTEKQNLDRQTNLVESCSIEKVFTDKTTGKNLVRKGFKEMMDYLRAGDTLYIESFSRLSRNTTDLLETVEKLTKKGVSLVSIKENIDTSTASGKFMLSVFSALSQFEREQLLERQKAGIFEAKKKGVKFGKPKLVRPDNWKEIKKKIDKKEISITTGSKLMNISRSSYYKLLKKK